MMKKTVRKKDKNQKKIDKAVPDNEKNGINKHTSEAQITGIDVSQGSSYPDGDLDGLINTLHSYAVNTPELLEEIKIVKEHS